MGDLGEVDGPCHANADGPHHTDEEGNCVWCYHPVLRLAKLEKEVARLDRLINNPHTDDFLEAVRIEAAHQRERWPADHDADKAPADWFWLIGYVAGKAIRPDTPKLLHHIITTAAVCLNWHRHVTRATDA
jgi:hypothetical protein